MPPKHAVEVIWVIWGTRLTAHPWPHPLPYRPFPPPVGAKAPPKPWPPAYLRGRKASEIFATSAGSVFDVMSFPAYVVIGGWSGLSNKFIHITYILIQNKIHLRPTRKIRKNKAKKKTSQLATTAHATSHTPLPKPYEGERSPHLAAGAGLRPGLWAPLGAVEWAGLWTGQGAWMCAGLRAGLCVGLRARPACRAGQRSAHNILNTYLMFVY